VKIVTSKEFLIGVVAAVLLVKFGDKLPVVGGLVAKLK